MCVACVIDCVVLYGVVIVVVLLCVSVCLCSHVCFGLNSCVAMYVFNVLFV